MLLVACANVASLTLARATSRSRELALRAALGATRGRLIQQLLAESLLLAAAGGTLGVVLAQLCLSVITTANVLSLPTRVKPLYLPGAHELQLDGTVVLFAVAASVATAALFGLFPAVRTSRLDLAAVLRETGAAAGRGSPRQGPFGFATRSLLVVGQVALSIVLLIGAALLMESFARAHRINPGFVSANLLTMKIALPPARYNTDPKKAKFFRELLPNVEGLSGVRNAAIALSIPTTAWIRTDITGIEGKPALDPNEPSSYAVLQSVTADYFRTLAIPLKRGREFTERDNNPGAPPVVIVNESLARRLWPGYPLDEDPIGRHIKEAYDKTIGWMEVVGIVADIHEGGLAYDASVPEFYVPYIVHPPQRAYLVVRTFGDPLRLANAIRGSVLGVDADQPVTDVRTMETVLDAPLGQRRLTTLLLGSFAAVAMLLALVGLYGVIAAPACIGRNPLARNKTVLQSWLLESFYLVGKSLRASR